MSKKNSFEFAILLVGGILQKLYEFAELEEEKEPDFIIETEIDYGPSRPPEKREDRPDVFEDLIGDPAQEIILPTRTPTRAIRF